jgi:hypothetical protein
VRDKLEAETLRASTAMGVMRDGLSPFILFPRFTPRCEEQPAPTHEEAYWLANA